jgi:hypothetical protein
MSLSENKALPQNKFINHKYLTAKESHSKESLSACKLSKPALPLIKYKPKLSANKIKKIEAVKDNPTQIAINARNALQFVMKYKNSKLAFNRNYINKQIAHTYVKSPTPKQLLISSNQIGNKYFTKLNSEHSKITYFFENAQLAPWNDE